MRRFVRLLLVLSGAMALFRLLPGCSALWQAQLALPLLQALHRLTAALPFPALEPLALILALCCFNRRARAVALSVALGMYVLLWYPAYFASATPECPAPDAAQMETLCVQLTDALNASPLQFDSPFYGAGAAGLDGARVKPVRYPEWMRALGISGLFSPWTGEALADGGAPPGYLPFTCVHELMHLRGIADEGVANIAAWQACMAQGGMYADSARLWALRYALGRLDGAGRERVTRRMDDRLRALLSQIEPRKSSCLSRVLGIDRLTRDYDALPDWIVANPD